MASFARGSARGAAISAEDDRTRPGEELLALLFAAGAMPSVEQVEAAAAESDAFAVIHKPDPAHGWIEVLVTGLSFELAWRGSRAETVVQRVGLPGDWTAEGREVLAIRPGPHLAGGANILPVVRGALALADALARATGPEAIVWRPAGVASDPGSFAEAVRSWLSGGAFPAPLLVSMARGDSGELVSSGLDFFVGQEIAIQPSGASGEDARLALRLADRLVTSGPVVAPEAVMSQEGQPISLQPSPDGARLTVRRGA